MVRAHRHDHLDRRALRPIVTKAQPAVHVGMALAFGPPGDQLVLAFGDDAGQQRARGHVAQLGRRQQQIGLVAFGKGEIFERGPELRIALPAGADLLGVARMVTVAPVTR